MAKTMGQISDNLVHKSMCSVIMLLPGPENVTVLISPHRVFHGTDSNVTIHASLFSGPSIF